MKFAELARYWRRLEETASRNEMMELLADIFEKADLEEIDKICYLSLGRLGPLFANPDFNLAEKMMIKAVGQAFNLSEEEAERRLKKKGDLGKLVEELMKIRKHKNLGLSVAEVYEKLRQVAEEEGEGSQERKLEGMALLFRSLDPLSAGYAARIPIGRMRLGFSDKTILDGLSFLEHGDKSAKKKLEKVYKVKPDIGRLARLVKKEGVEGAAKDSRPEVGVPILMAKAQRMSSAEEILLKIGDCAVEPKIDGFRLQCHMKQSKKGKKIKLFSRSLEEVTFMYPDIVEGIEKGVEAESIIFEGEAVAYNPQTGDFLSFQETVQRKRKYGIQKMIKSVPLQLISFDLLYFNGEDFLSKPYEVRREKLEEIIGSEKEEKEQSVVVAAEKHNVSEEKELDLLFDEAMSRGFEGVMAKRLDAPYQAGARNWNWIKYKRSYSAELADTLDCLVMGYDYGRGKRTEFGIGGFLAGVYDEEMDVFKTVSKIGTGLTDEQWKEMKSKAGKFEVKGKPARYEMVKEVEADVWLSPELVVEIEADEITKSPVHTAGWGLRFPRLKRFRDDKRPEQATTLVEIKKMSGGQNES